MWSFFPGMTLSCALVLGVPSPLFAEETPVGAWAYIADCSMSPQRLPGSIQGLVQLREIAPEIYSGGVTNSQGLRGTIRMTVSEGWFYAELNWGPRHLSTTGEGEFVSGSAFSAVDSNGCLLDGARIRP